RAPRPGEEEGRTPRHDLSETESEEEDNPCQADAIAWKEGTQTKRLSKERCKDESYDLSKTRRACSVEGCGKVAQTVKGSQKEVHQPWRGARPAAFAGCHTQARNADQVLTGLTWEEIAGIPDEDLRKRAIFLKQRGATPGPTSGGPDRSASRTDAPDDSQALFAYMEARLQGKGHDSAVEVSEVDGRTPSERQRRLRELARRHCIRITSELPAEASKFIWELAQPQVSTDGQPGGGFYPWTASDPGPPSHHQSRTSPWAAPAPERPWAAQGSDHRPTAQALFRQNPGAGGAGGRTDAVDALAQATRAFRAGAFTDAEAPAADETTKALQAIAKSLTSKEDALAQERGKLASIGRLEERLVFLLRGCDSLSVTLCPGVVGKELFHALRIAGTQARPQLRKIEFPCNIQNRHSYGFAALQLGGKTLNTLPEYCLSAGDFPLTSEEDFDNYGGSPDLKLERKGRYPNTLTSWFRAALRQSWAFSCLFGEEYYPVLEKAASHLLRLGEQHGYAWPASAVYGAWEELWARFCEEARELDRRIRRAMQDETPTFARLKFFALSPGPDGQPWLQLPGTFRLDDDTQYFCTDMLPRMQRQLSRACWAGAQKKGNTGGRAAGEGDATEAADKAAPPKLLGPSLTPKEAAAPKWTTLDYTVQLQLLRRGGLKGSKAKTGDEVDREFTRVRAEQAAKAAAAKQEGIAAAKAKASTTQRTTPAAGTGNTDRTSRAGERVPEQTGHVVADLDNVLPTDREETLGALLKDEGSNWWRDVDADAATLTCPSSKFEKSARADAAEPALGPYPTGLVGVYLRNRLLRLREETGRAPELEDVTHLLEEAVSLGGPELSEEAARLLEERGVHRKAGESPLVQLSGLTWNSTIGAGTLTWKGVGHWAMYDYQDQLPLSSEACEQMGFAAACDEPKATPDQPLPTPEAVWALASEWRVRWCSQARVAEDSLGPTPERLTQAEADVRVFHHDLLHFGHDRDYRTLVAHPLEEWECLGLAVLRLDAYMRPSVEVVCGRRYSGKAEDTRWVLVHRGHMRLLVPDESCLPPLGSRELEAAGWEAYLEEAEGSPLLDAGPAPPAAGVGAFHRTRRLRLCLGPLPDAAAAAAALTYITEGGVSCLWLLPAALPPGPPADEWSSVLRLAAAQLQTGGRCVLEAPLYRRAWTDKATRIQLAGACWHAERLPSPLLGPAGGVTMLRASFCVPPGLAALCSTGGGEEDFASKMQRLKTVLDNPAGEAERKSQEADLSEGTGDSVRCGKLFADSGPLLGPPPSWLPKSLSKEAEEAAEAYLQKVHQVEYSLEAWNGAVQAGTTLLRLCGGWKETVGALRYAWRARGEDHFAGLFDHDLDSHLPEDLLAWVRRVAQEGVKAEYRGTQRDATRGRVLLMSPGPDEEDLLDGVDDHFPAIQPRYAEVVRLVMWYKSRYPGVRILLAKKDVSEAFKDYPGQPWRRFAPGYGLVPRYEWEDDAEALVRLWLGGKLEGRSTTRCSGMGGKGNQKGKGAHKGRRDQEKLERLRGSFRARSDADRRRLVKILRHEAALLGLPIREDGWVSLKDINECVGTISGEDAARIIGRDEKDRLILSQEGEEVWVAAVSGHTIAGVVGPGRELPLQEVPEVLVHGSYARHSNNILKEGAARYAQVRFLLTTNDIYLAPDGIPDRILAERDEEMELIEVAEQRNSDQYPPEGSPKSDEPMSSVERSAPGIAEATLEGLSAPGAAAQEAVLKEEQAAPGQSASTSAEARFAPGEGETQAIWGPKVEEGGPLQPLVDAAQALGEVALAEPEAIALKVDPDTLTAEIGKMSLEDEDPDWSGDEAEIPVATALPGEAASSSTKQEEGRGTKKELELDETEEPPRRRKVVLATGQLSLFRALAAANASNWSGVQRALREAQGSGEVENVTSLAQAFSKNRDACAQAASRAAALAELEGAEAAYFAALPPALAELERKNPVRPSMDKSLGWINHARFLQDKEAAGVWVARRKEKSRLRAAAHRAAQQSAEGVGAGAQDPVRDQADAASHLNFQMNEAARDNLRRFQAELRAGELDAPMRAAVAQKRKPESERRRRIKWARFCEKQGKTRKYDPTERSLGFTPPQEGHAVARFGPGRCPTEDGLEHRGIPGPLGDGRYLQHTASECTAETHQPSTRD
ncbi:TRPT1, partial [Symbiodinium sp. CCMP2592]